MTHPTPVRTLNEDVWFDWEYGRITLQWMIFDPKFKSAYAKVRGHTGPGELPWHSSVDVWVRNKTYYLTGFVSKASECKPTGDEYRALREYLDSFGITEKKPKRLRDLLHGNASLL